MSLFCRRIHQLYIYISQEPGTRAKGLGGGSPTVSTIRDVFWATGLRFGPKRFSLLGQSRWNRLL